MTNCKDKCWCRKLKIKAPDGDAPPLMQDLFSMAHKIEHLYDGVEKCFEKIELIIMAISSEGRIEDFVKQNVDKIHERIDQLESSTDFEKAHKLIYDGAQTHASILKLQAQVKEIEESPKVTLSYHDGVFKRIEEIEIWIKSHQEEGEDYGKDFEKRDKEIMERLDNLEGYMGMEDRVTASDVLFRLYQLETSVDFEKAKELIYAGAQTHATILKLQARIEALEGNKMHIPDMSKYPDFEKFMKRKDKFILDENNNAIPADLFEWSNFFENETEKRIVRQDEINGKWVSSVFLGIDHAFGLFYPEHHIPLIFETMVFNSKKGGSEIYCERFPTWKDTEEGHKLAIQWVIEGCKNND